MIIALIVVCVVLLGAGASFESAPLFLLGLLFVVAAIGVRLAS